MLCRCEALQSEARQSEAIPSGMASTIIPINDNDYCPNLGSVLLEAMPLGIASDCSASASQCLATTQHLCFIVLRINLFRIMISNSNNG